MAKFQHKIGCVATSRHCHNKSMSSEKWDNMYYLYTAFIVRCWISETGDAELNFLFSDVMDDQLLVKSVQILNFRIPLSVFKAYITSISHFHQAIQTFMIKRQFLEIKLACRAIQQRLIYIARQLIHFSNDSRPKWMVCFFFQGCTLKFVYNQCDNHLNLTCCRKLHVLFRGGKWV